MPPQCRARPPPRPKPTPVAGRPAQRRHLAGADSGRAPPVRAQSASPNSEIHIYRQGLILLMTTFDVAVFDLARAALRADFFGLISKFGNDKLSLQEIGAFGDLDALRDGIIEQQLKKVFIRELLFLLQKMGATLTDSKDRFPELIEIVLRRNLHVHNRGFVDEKYLEGNFNIYELKLGDFAVVDWSYFLQAVELLTETVKQISRWVATIKPTNGVAKE
jgi:hypothetical protein